MPGEQPGVNPAEVAGQNVHEDEQLKGPDLLLRGDVDDVAEARLEEIGTDALAASRARGDSAQETIRSVHQAQKEYADSIGYEPVDSAGNKVY